MSKFCLANLKGWSFRDYDEDEDEEDEMGPMVLYAPGSSWAIWLLTPATKKAFNVTPQKGSKNLCEAVLFDSDEFSCSDEYTVSTAKELDDLVAPVLAYIDHYSLCAKAGSKAISTILHAGLFMEDDTEIEKCLLTGHFVGEDPKEIPIAVARNLLGCPSNSEMVHIMPGYDHDAFVTMVAGLGVEKSEAEDLVGRFERHQRSED